MAKLATLTPVATPYATPKSALRSKSSKPDTVTYEGGDGFTRKPKSELFLLAVSNMVGEDTFYEGKTDRDQRFRDLIHKVVGKDAGWVARFVPFLRNEMNMRSASIVMAVEYVKAGGPGGRQVIDSAIQRADEPAEIIGYYRSRYGRNLPQPIKRGIADAVRRLYNERTAIKYDGDNSGYRLADVIDIVHPEPKADWQSRLFKYLLDKRHNRPTLSTEGLDTLSAYSALMSVPVAQRRALLEEEGFVQRLQDAGMTWESLSGWLQGPMDAKAWEAIIPNMGYMALLRNLRNFEQAGISKEAQAKVIATLTDPVQVAKSRQFPLRFYSAYKAVGGFGYLQALEDALNLTLENVPTLKGRTLILVDNSSSMGTGFSTRGTTTNREIAALFGAAVALRAESADLVAYADEGKIVQFSKSDPLLKVAKAATYNGGGTRTMDVLAQHYKGHDRVVILTDEQAFAPSTVSWGYYASRASKDDIAAIKAPIYTFNLVGYRAGHMESGQDNRYTFSGLTDAGFRLMSLIESGKDAEWPF
jgi:hypothetical protein